ncbi:hypothetical protein ATCC90586_007375 [Pythium insidiosum]|nr:hypothetical protein ATCC90586_007375 [Pythium insidiosum]
MAEMERWADEVMATLPVPNDDDEAKFFEDLPPMTLFGQQYQRSRHSAIDATEAKTPTAETATHKQTPAEGTGAMSRARGVTAAVAAPTQHRYQSYSFSQSTVVGEDGKPVTSTRRRYEDSSGRLKATHERCVNGQVMRQEWRRETASDKGRSDTICSIGDVEAFEAAWRATPFGRAASGVATTSRKEALKDAVE